MEKAEENLPANLEKLQIGPMNLRPHSVENFNPFGNMKSFGSPSCPEPVFRSPSLHGAACPTGSCVCNKKKKAQESVFLQKTSFKRQVLQKSRLGSVTRRGLRPPILRVKENMPLMEPMDSPKALTSHLASLDLSTSQGKVLALDTPNDSGFRSLVLVKVNSKSYSIFNAEFFKEMKREIDKHSIAGVRKPRRRTYSDSTTLALPSSETVENTSNQRPQASCSIQARMTPPDDTNIDELASYFDLLVHIPKKMSHMAEMMYI